MRVPIVAGAALLLASCYYQSSHPIGVAERAELDDALIGIWRNADPSSKDVVLVRAFDEHTYVVEIENQGERTLLRAFVGQLRTTRFIDVQEIGDAEPNFTIFRYDWSGDTLVLRGIKENAPPPAASHALLQRWVLERLDSKEIYAEPVRLVREVEATR